MAEAQKAAEKAAESKPRTASKAKESGVRGEWPFNKDHYIATESTSLRGHHEGEYVRMVQEQLDVKVTGTFDEKTREALIEYQEENDLPVTGVVDAETWEHFSGKE